MLTIGQLNDTSSEYASTGKQNNLWNRLTFLHKHPDNLKKVEITFQWKFFEKLFTSGHLARL